MSYNVSKDDDLYNKDSKEFLTMMVGDQMFGIPVLQVQDILGERSVTKVPLAVKEVAGAMNLRGRIVTAIDLRYKLNLPKLPKGSKSMYIVVDYQGELYSLIVDSVGEVLSLSNKSFEKTLSTIDSSWRELSMGIYRLDDELLVIMDVPGMLESLCIKGETAA